MPKDDISVVSVTKHVGDTDVSDLPSDGVRERLRAKGSRREKQTKRRVLSKLTGLLDRNAAQYQEWMDRIAKENPAKAMTLTVAMLEFVVPKLGRIEQTGTVEHKVSTFVPVIEREKGPPALEGEFAEVPKP